MTGPIFPCQLVEDAFPEINSLFKTFKTYWYICSERGKYYTLLQVEFFTSDIYQILRNYWNRKRWDIDELNTICDALNNCYDLLDPNFSMDKKLAYIEHLKNWYELGFPWFF